MRTRGFEIISSYLDAGIKLPQRQTAHSAGYDIEAAEDFTVPPRSFKAVPTGLKAYMQPDEFLAVHIRSGLAFKHGVSLVNDVGVVDADYYNNPSNEGHIVVGIANPTDRPFQVKKGQKIAQGIFLKYHLADRDAAAGERNGGFGSTGE
jgi:dUTP pyrophosphatase